ncbi:msr4725 [Mesorhizobium japonicum MAFF 303099]|uniref:Msr4725 protein n=1 Tax=Mesorhizobium japonicum (strain LMG 29417 / CECT 9101 / MAFF 303099) TaxID=266835 RepID=Q98DF6_RHILO|nr:msr4725 [Mesorhizobium japonicum MAFF 303099]
MFARRSVLRKLALLEDKPAHLSAICWLRVHGMARQYLADDPQLGPIRVSFGRSYHLRCILAGMVAIAQDAGLHVGSGDLDLPR